MSSTQTLSTHLIQESKKLLTTVSTPGPAIQKEKQDSRVSRWPERKLPDDASRPDWREHCPEIEWKFTSDTDQKDIKYALSSNRLIRFIKEPHMIDDDLDYWVWIPRKLRR